MKDRVHRQPRGVEAWTKFTEREKQLLSKFTATKTAIHKALCGRSSESPTHTLYGLDYTTILL